MVNIDKRLEFLEALVIATKQVNTKELNEELDFVEYYNITYVKELVNKININKYKEVIEYINDIKDCSYYTNLFLYFDNDFNLDNSAKFEPFENKSTIEFAKLIKIIYQNEKIEEVFIKYKKYLNNLIKEFNQHYEFSFKKELSKMYGPINNYKFNIYISLLINGGFSVNKDRTISYIQGIKIRNNKDIIFNEYTTVCLYHEYSHFFVNKIVDKYYNSIKNIDILYNESIKNGLPKIYQSKRTLLYEYFVRANSMILSEKQISKEEYKEDIKWFKEIGFTRIEEIIIIIKKGLQNHLYFENIFKTIIINYLNNR